jgi:hypothetical protein
VSCWVKASSQGLLGQGLLSRGGPCSGPPGGAAQCAGPPLTAQGRLRRRFAIAARPLTCEPLRPLRARFAGRPRACPSGARRRQEAGLWVLSLLSRGGGVPEWLHTSDGVGAHGRACAPPPRGVCGRGLDHRARVRGGSGLYFRRVVRRKRARGSSHRGRDHLGGATEGLVEVEPRWGVGAAEGLVGAGMGRRGAVARGLDTGPRWGAVPTRPPEGVPSVAPTGSAAFRGTRHHEGPQVSGSHSAATGRPR